MQKRSMALPFTVSVTSTTLFDNLNFGTVTMVTPIYHLHLFVYVRSTTLVPTDLAIFLCIFLVQEMLFLVV